MIKVLLGIVAVPLMLSLFAIGNGPWPTTASQGRAIPGSAGSPPDPTMSWLRQFGTNGADWGYGVDGDNEGNVYVAGAVILMYLLHLWDIASGPVP